MQNLNIKDLTSNDAASTRTKSRRLIFQILGFFVTAVAVSGASLPVSIEEQGLGVIVKEFRGRLHVSQPVSASIVDANAYLVSVEPSSETGKSFVIKFDKTFLGTLDDEELRAVIAHELGHVWIFNHHPYLQTESLANEKALQLVSRDSLDKVYDKIWQLEDKKGTREEFLAKFQ